MASVASKGAPRAGFRPSFHLWMALAMCFFIFGGFGLTYLAPMAAGTRPPDPPVVHLHGVVFFAWMLLLVLQSALVNVKNVKLHRSLGQFGVALAGIIVFLGLLITIISMADSRGEPVNYGLMYLSLIAPISFAAIFAMAIRAVRKPAVHRNLILLATLSILMPGINRLYMVGFALDGVPFYSTYMTMNAMLALILWQERRATGSISQFSWISAAIILVPQAFLYPVAGSEWFQALCNGMPGLIYYR